MLYHLRFPTHDTGVVSSNPACVALKTSLGRKAMGNHRIKSTFLLSLVSAKLEIEYATQQSA